MSKRTFIWFGVLVLVLAVVIPWLAFRGKGDADSSGQDVAASLKQGQTLFDINCGNCHTLYAAGTDGNLGPDLDDLLAPQGEPATKKADIEATEGRVLNAIENGVDSSAPNRMPAGILDGELAKEVARFVAHTAGEG